MKKFYIFGLTILIAICSCFGVLSIATNVENVSGEALADDNFASVSVIGEASTEVAPDRAKITASIQTLSSDMKESKEKNFDILDCAIKALVDFGVDREGIRTEYFTCYPSYDNSYAIEIQGYYATTNFSFYIENLENIKGAIDVITDCGVTTVRNINYEVSNYEEIYNQTMIDALENAKLKASKLVEGEGELPVLSISEEYVYCCGTLYKDYTDAMVENDLVGKITIQAKLKVEFALN